MIRVSLRECTGRLQSREMRGPSWALYFQILQVIHSFRANIYSIADAPAAQLFLKMAGKLENAGDEDQDVHAHNSTNLPHVDMRYQQYCGVGSALILVS
jgi:hypothetical protein